MYGWLMFLPEVCMSSPLQDRIWHIWWPSTRRFAESPHTLPLEEPSGSPNLRRSQRRRTGRPTIESKVKLYRMDICMYVRMYLCMCICMYGCMYTLVTEEPSGYWSDQSMHVCMNACMYMCECIYVCMYVCMYVGLVVCV